MDIRRFSGGFLPGLFCGSALVAISWAGSSWWKARDNRSPVDAAIYDKCLVSQQGSAIACDAFMRVVDRDRAKSAYLRSEGAKMLAAGFSKREVVEWATKQGGVGSQLSDAAGISLRELQEGKY